MAVPAAAVTAVSRMGASTRTPRGTHTNAPPSHTSEFQRVNTSSSATTRPRCGSTSSGWRSRATDSGSTTGPSSTAEPSPNAPSTWSSRTPAGRSNNPSGTADRSPSAGAPNDARSSRLRSVNSQPGRPLKLGSSRVAVSANGAFHLELDQPVHLDRVLHRELLDDRLDEPVDD